MHFSTIETGIKFRIGPIEMENFIAINCDQNEYLMSTGYRNRNFMAISRDQKKFEISKGIEI